VTPTLDEFLDILEESPYLEVLHLERAGPKIPDQTSILPQRHIALPNLREARFLIFNPSPMNFQHRILECITTPPFVEILFSHLQSDVTDLHTLLPGFPFCDNVNDITFISSFEYNPCAAAKLHNKNQLTIQTNADAVTSYLSSLGAQFPHLTHIRFQNALGNLPWPLLLNLYNLTAVTISGSLDFYNIPSLIHLLNLDQPSTGSVPCPRLGRITIYAVGLNAEHYELRAKMLAKQLVENPIKVVHRKGDKNFEVHLVEEKNEIPPLDIRWTRRW
jgi:hypothetical protein